MQGRPPTARPRLRPPVRGDRLRPGPARNGGQWCPQGATAARKGSSPQGWRLRAEASPVGTAACSVASARGAGCRTPARGYHEQGWSHRPQRWPPRGRGVAGGQRQLPPVQGQRRRRRRRGGKMARASF
ncbi:hypothetical protein BHM03_00045037 [Ensete ventricosum]|nr:hypothetical protein BHM03_00045037 [Ensete ventricosum]